MSREKIPELHRPVLVERVGAGGLERLVEADSGECDALAVRLGVPALPALSCRYRLTAEPAGRIRAEARLSARVVRVCVVSLEEFEMPVEELFVLRFVPAGTEDDDLDPESEDEIPYEGAMIDLGEATAEQLALALDPYPRRPGAALPGAAAADESPLATLSFAALARRPPRN